MKKYFSFVLLLLLLVLPSCANRFEMDTSIPEKQFVFVSQEVEVSFCKKGTEFCSPSSDGKAYGSGVLIAHSSKKNKSYYLTAGHVCSLDMDDMELPPAIEAKFDQEIHLLSYDGKDVVAEIVAVDEEHDICLLESDRVSNTPVVIETGKLRKHMKVWNVAAPAGIWDRDMMIHFDGEYQGVINDKAVYTIAAQPGSSGSPVYDPETGRLIGIIVSVMPPSYDISFGPTLEQINDFLDDNLPCSCYR